MGKKRLFIFSTVQTSTSFVLNFAGCYVPGLESVQASILW